jgi:hypothetical protein
VDVLRVDLVELGRLPVPCSLDRLLLAVGEVEPGMDDDLALLLAVLRAGLAVGVDDLRGGLGVAERPQAVPCLPATAAACGPNAET